MGLVFQSRGFLQVRAPDQFLGARNTGWVVTGRNHNFFHYCQELKGSSFAAARDVFQHGLSLGHSRGFFSLQEDWLDCRDRSRAYVLDRGRFREVNTRNIESTQDMPPGLFQHFEWCRHCFYPRLGDGFPSLTGSLDALITAEEPVDVTGWFFIQDENQDFPSLMELFSHPEIAAISQSSGCRDHYLFVGEETTALDGVIRPVQEASKRFPQGKGLLFVLGESSYSQIVVAEGQGRVLAPMALDQLEYHDAVEFPMGPGYEQR
jgi:hypothetical protein